MLGLIHKHYAGGSSCLYCDNLVSNKMFFPVLHSALKEWPATNCVGYIHAELQRHESIPGVSGPSINLVMSCQVCGLTGSVEFFDYVERFKPYAYSTSGEIAGCALGKMHVIQSEAALLSNFEGDPNLKPRTRGEKIEILRAEVHAFLCELLDRMKIDFEQASPDKHDWKCCPQSSTKLIAGSRSSEARHTVLVCDSCGQFRVFGDVEGKHYSVRFSLYHPNSLIAAGRPLERIKKEEPASPIADLTVKATKAIRHSAADIAATLEAIDHRCMAADGDVTETVKEITAAELKKIYRCAKRIVDEVPERIHS